MPDIKPCPFCGGTDIDVNDTVLPGEETRTYCVGCPDCGVWYDWLFDSAEEAIAAWNERASTKRNDMTSSHSEKDILKGCISLMESLTGRFEDYLDFIGHEPSDEEGFSTAFYMTEIVERLFLWNTRHGGGTSQRMKCRELGVDEDKRVVFEDKREADEA